jgi:miniconductance mechanosensitive channel
MLQDLADIHPLLPAVAGVLGLLLLAVLADLLVKRGLVRAIQALARRTAVTWDDVLIEHNVGGRIAQVIPALIVYSGLGFVPGLPVALVTLLQNVAVGYMVLMTTLALSATLSAASQIYETYPVSRERPLKGIVQLVQILVWILGGILIVAAVLDRSPLLLLSGLGAMTAILLLVFKDTLLGLVASVQLTAHDMVRVGDWIEMPQYGADGDVIDVALHTVKVQNWDKTITTIPTYRLISESFRNWRGMSESGGRRIKRSIYIDKTSIRFLEPAEVERFKRFALLRDYIEEKERELAHYNARLTHATEAAVNQRRLTNIGTLRAYVRHYLGNHPRVRQDMTLLVRQLAPTPEGLPLEIYCFTNTTAWAEYEDIQADIFDHVLALVREFGLEVFQAPAGRDLARLATGTRPAG